MLMAGLTSGGHDSAFCILENGKPIMHIELERIIRQKQPNGDAFQLLMDHYPEFKKIKYFTEIVHNAGHLLQDRYPYAFELIKKITSKNGGDFFYVGHHQAHAANAFYSSNFEDALVVTMDGGGWDIVERQEDGFDLCKILTFTAWIGKDKKINPIFVSEEKRFNIGETWNYITKNVFGLNIGWPHGSQVGSVMAMASYGDPEKYYNHFKVLDFKHRSLYNEKQKNVFLDLVRLGKNNEKEQFDIAAALQKYTEDAMFNLIKQLLQQSGKNKLCLSGGVALNCVMVGKMHTEFEDLVDDIYICPVPYDAGLAIGAPQYIYHHTLENDRIKWENNFTPYLGKEYSKQCILDTIEKYSELLSSENKKLDDVLHMLDEGKIISLFHGGSESGRRALGNRSIIADPRNPDMKDIINQKVKHRQWYRPFAPSILKECVKDWFVKDVNSPYMGKAIKFKEGKEKEVPAVNHVDNTARLQTVTKEDNELYYNLIKRWYEISGVPIVLNTSFNDREPIVETPEDGIKCFLNTNIDHMYFLKHGILLSKK